MVWEQLSLEKPHIAYACVGIFSTFFSLLSLFVKERLYIGEATVATIAGLILGPHCLGWFNPLSWGDAEYITLEISRIVLCIQIVAVAVELPRKYMKKHWLSVAIFLLPVMVMGWLVVGLFVWCLIPHFNYAEALLVSACVTATDPVLAAAVVGKGKFAERVPGHLRNLLSAESGSNDGMAVPFIFLSLNLVLHPGNAHEVFKDWFLNTVLWECCFGCILGVVIGYVSRKAVTFAEKKKLIDRESFLAIFIFIAFNSAGLGSMLGVDDLLTSFAAGTAFGWNGAFAKKTEESHVSTVIDLLLNLAFFVYFGAIVPWQLFNASNIGLDVWRLIVLAIVVVFLRRLPAVLALKPFTPDVKTWREAIFCGHFGPIGVGAIFGVLLARGHLSEFYHVDPAPLNELPSEDQPHYLLYSCLWPMVSFLVITSIIVHGSSVAVLTLGKRLNRMAITMSFTATNTQDQGPNWMSRLQKLDKVSTSFSLQRVDTHATSSEDSQKLNKSNTIETSGIKVRPAGGAKRRKHKKQKKRRTGGASALKHTLSRGNASDEEEQPERHRPQAEFLQLGRTPSAVPPSPESNESQNKDSYDDSSSQNEKSEVVLPTNDSQQAAETNETSHQVNDHEDQYAPEPESTIADKKQQKESIPTTAFQEGEKIIIEDQHGEVVESLPLKQLKEEGSNVLSDRGDAQSIHSLNSLKRKLSQYSAFSGNSSRHSSQQEQPSINKKLERTHSRTKNAYYRKSDPSHRKVYAHQVDNLIVIENEEGEIIRRYRVNPHINPAKARSRSSSIVGKALSLVGIKQKVPEASANSQVTPDSSNIPSIHVSGSSENRQLNVLEVQHDSKNPISPLDDPKITSRVENKLTQILNNNNLQKVDANVPARLERVPSRVSEYSEEDEEDEDLSENSEEDEDDDEDDDEHMHETEVEKRRRLAALGHSKRDAKDEEE